MKPFLCWFFAVVLVLYLDSVRAVEVWAGLSVHPSEQSKPEVTLGNPLFTIEASHAFKPRLKVFCSHTSGVFTIEDGYALNQCGVKVKLF